MAILGDITLGPGINDIAVSGFSGTPRYPVANVTLEAHPSNSAVLYVRKRAGTGFGYPLAAGASVSLTNVDLYDYTASGVNGLRLAYVANQ